MNQTTFKENLLKTLEEIKPAATIPFQEYKFAITLVSEQEKDYDSTDDLMRLWVLTEQKVKNRLFSLDDVISLLSAPSERFPLWIHVHQQKMMGDYPVIELKTSLRFRKPSQLHHQETGHPPFIYKSR